ncbi:PREDICTED: nucleic-acid-binding protein from mobile element jockey-like [Habropoda laboriosa]|uniref:nucleic-acid-binding protein from mobile element jockey-like n=1 Tax=Habropoda laboriosa TaxID=597456 RepID=UPI00083DEAC5|nr:PREDICTED: nucleic-acid-binding protein from mobile element jockey-like [Habropoda laboriosa]
MVLKGLPKFTPTEIIEELKLNNVNPITCTEIQKDPHNTHPVYKITFASGTSFEHVRKIGILFRVRIYWEKYDSRKPFIQCYRCQAHGHTSANCNKNPNCVKCAKNHLTKDCLKTRDTSATCFNCKGDHPANYNQCPALLAYLAKRAHIQTNPRQPPTQSNTIHAPIPTPSFPTKSQTHPTLPHSRTYAQAIVRNTTGNTPHNQFEPPSNNSDFQNIRGIFQSISHIKSMCDIKTLITAFKMLADKLKNCTTNTERLVAFLEVSTFLDD